IIIHRFFNPDEGNYWCILVAKFGALLFSDFGAVVVTDYSSIRFMIPLLMYYENLHYSNMRRIIKNDLCLTFAKKQARLRW
ncbi:MAG: hypothetical protein ACK40G_05390, partial [Cytophagaceae bacterium]